MTAIEIKRELSKLLTEKGLEAFSKIVSDSINEMGDLGIEGHAEAHRIMIQYCRSRFVEKFQALSNLNSTEK
jgi:hypothetical protein